MEYKAKYVNDIFKPSKVSKDSWGFTYCPKQIIDEFNKRWEETTKVSFEQFVAATHTVEAIESGINRWYFNTNEECEAYDSYIVGDPSRRYPNLPILPITILHQIIKDYENAKK